MAETSHPRSSLPEPAGGLRALAARPTLVALVALAVFTALGWLYLAAMVAGMAESGHASALGPGMSVFERLLGGGLPEGLARDFLVAICRPTFGSADAATTLADLAIVAAMWVAMALAMMLPTAAPMVLTYADLAEAARARGEPAASPLALIAGYAGVWIAFALVAAVLQSALVAASLLDSAMMSAGPLFSGVVFVGAGLYQFTPLKHACVTRCRRPLPFFLVSWAEGAAGVFRLGVRQGLFCLGCCIALMAVMFAVGTMNVIWMAALGLVMGIEKITVSTRFSVVIGIVLVVIGVLLVGGAIASHWPSAAT